MPVRFTNFLSIAVRLPGRIIRLLRRDWRAFFLLLRMAFWVTALSVLVRLLPLPKAFSLIAPQLRPTTPDDPQAVQEKLASLIDQLLALDVLVFTPTCWKRAVVLHRFLALNGIRNQIVFGVRNAQEKLLEGHAWLEAGNEPILEKIAPKYTKIYAFP